MAVSRTSLIARLYRIRIIIHSHVNTFATSKSHDISDQRQTPTKRNRQKLHNRILTEEEKLDNRQHSKDFNDILREGKDDKFGNTTYTSNKSKFKSSMPKISDPNVNIKLLGHGFTAKKSARNTRINRNDKTSERFGLLSVAEVDEDDKKRRLEHRYRDEPEEDEHHIRLSPFGRRNTQWWYGKRIEEFGHQGKIIEAVEVLEEWMLKRDRVMPTSHHFTAVMGILGRAGYTKKCFHLFNQMKKMGLEPTDPTYTSLFNACANSPWSGDGLSRALKLHDLIHAKGYQPNLPVFHSMIKAYAKCGDMAAAFRTMDELQQSQLQPTDETYGFLLMACCSHKEAGLLHAIQVWRLMREQGITPNTIHYNLLLRAVRDCGIGQADVAAQTLFLMDQDRRRLTAGGRKVRQNSRTKIHEGVVKLMDDETQDNRHVKSNERSNDYSLDIRSVSSQVLHENVDRNTESIENLQTNTANTNEIIIDNDVNLIKSSTDKSSNLCSDSYSQINDNSTISSQIDLTNENSTMPSQADSSISSQLDENSTIPSKEVENLRTDTRTFNALVPSNHRPVINLSDVTTPRSRLTLIGGLHGFMRHLSSENVTPDVKTFTLLVDVIDQTMEEEDCLVEYMERSGAEIDVDFYNLLIEKRTKRGDQGGARAIVSKISERGLRPNMRTFGCLALGCRRKADGMQLLQHIESCGLATNIETYEILVYHSFADFSYTRLLLEHLTSQGLSPNQKILQCIESALDKARRNIVKLEQAVTADSYYKSAYFQRGYKDFMTFYPVWLKGVAWSKPAHPWAQFIKEKQETVPS